MPKQTDQVRNGSWKAQQTQGLQKRGNEYYEASNHLKEPPYQRLFYGAGIESGCSERTKRQTQ